MPRKEKPLILVTNDDGINSPGLAAAVAALDPLGEVLIIAPLVQQTSRGRSRPIKGGSHGKIVRAQVTYGEQQWDAAAVDATPALTVQHGLHELASRDVDLVVSGINYGENVGSCVTVSGTIGAALEAADAGVPAIAISLELADSDYFSLKDIVDFAASIHFLRQVSARMLANQMPADVDVIKIEIPVDATPGSPCAVTRQDPITYYSTEFETRPDPFEGTTQIRSYPAKGKYSQPGTDAHALAQGWVSITPLSLDLTSRVELKLLEDIFQQLS
jgi:5'-nucleotidase